MAEVNLPEGWLEVLLPDVIFFQEGPGLRKYQYTESGTPFLNIRTLKNGMIDKTMCQFLSNEEVANKYQHFLLTEGDIVCSTSGTIGKTAVVKSADLPLLLNTSIIRFRALVDETVARSFLLAFLNSNVFLLQALKKATGTAQKNVGPSHLKEFYFPLPPLAEQKVIAEKLDSLLAQVDNTKARLERIPEILKRFRQSVLAAAVSGKLTEEWREFNKTQLPYVARQLSEIINEMRNGLSPKPNELGNGYPILRISSVRSFSLDQADIRHLDVPDKDKERFKLELNDLLFTRYNGSIDFVGVCARVAELKHEVLLYPDKLIRVRVDKNQVIPEYLEIFSASQSARDYIYSLVKSTSGQKGISGADLKLMKVNLPSVSEQTEIVRRVEELFAFADRIEQTVQAALSRVNNLTQSILAKAFRGELTADWRAANPELISGDNSAEALLARIKAERAKVSSKKSRKVATVD